MPESKSNNRTLQLVILIVVVGLVALSMIPEQPAVMPPTNEQVAPPQSATRPSMPEVPEPPQPNRPSPVVAELLNWIQTDPPEPEHVSEVKYVGRESCAACHPNEAKKWAGSDHDWAIEHPTPQTVKGNFDDQTIDHFGTKYRMYRDGDKFMVQADGPDGTMQTYPVKYTFGYEPLQQYLAETHSGRLQTLPTTWDTEKQRWYHIYAHEAIPHTDELHWTKPLQNWNYMCADCHSTNLQKNYDVETDTYHTTWSDMDVSCESCHGPAEKHVAWANGDRSSTPDHFGFAFNMADRDFKAQIETCAKCHTRRQLIFPHERPGDQFLDHFSPSLLEDNLYYADGQIKDEVYVYGSFIQSKMYHNKVRCTDCHDAHTTKLILPGNLLCARCHEKDGPKFDIPEHHHHPVGTKGASCVECHMTQTTYMGVDARRDHSFQIPRPDLTIKLGIPNACNKCHTDKDAQWASDWIVKWYGPKRPGEEKGPHFAHTIAAARQHKPDAQPGLIKLLEDKERPAILRATTARLLGDYHNEQSTRTLERFIMDSDPLVRAAAIRAIEGHQSGTLRDLLDERLDDPIRLVRTEAARVLMSLHPEESLAGESKRDRLRRLGQVLQEYKQGLRMTFDHPGSHLNMAVLFGRLHSPGLVEKSYKQALRINPTFVPALMNLSTFYAQQNRSAEAEQLLRTATTTRPDFGESFYSLGLLVAETPSRLAEAAKHLKKASELMPDRPRVAYNYGLTLMHQERREDAEVVLRKAFDLAPDQSDIIQALVILFRQMNQPGKIRPLLMEAHSRAPQVPDYLQALTMMSAEQGDLDASLMYAEKLAKLRPNDPNVQNIVRQLRSRMTNQ